MSPQGRTTKFTVLKRRWNESGQTNLVSVVVLEFTHSTGSGPPAGSGPSETKFCFGLPDLTLRAACGRLSHSVRFSLYSMVGLEGPGNCGRQRASGMSEDLAGSMAGAGRFMESTMGAAAAQ